MSNDVRSWIHVDNVDNVDNYKTQWAGIIYLTPNAPVTGGTGFFKHKKSNIDDYDTEILNNSDELTRDRYDNTKWELVSSVGNIFNRLILFRSNQYHMSLEYFGTNIHDARLVQLFFLKTHN